MEKYWLRYFTARKPVFIPASALIAFADDNAKLRRLLAPLNIYSTLSHTLHEGDEIFFSIPCSPFLITYLSIGKFPQNFNDFCTLLKFVYNIKK